MKTLVLSVVLAVLGIAQVASAFDSELAFQDPAMQARYENMTRLLRCPMCQNQAIADSPVGVAADLRRELREQMAAGRTDAEIMDFMTARYGDFILYNPPVNPKTWLLWAAPVLLLLIGLASAAVIIVRRSKGEMDDSADETSTSEAGSV
jgi:cytochrome c-type biogenesis protein CcmH